MTENIKIKPQVYLEIIVKDSDNMKVFTVNDETKERRPVILRSNPRLEYTPVYIFETKGDANTLVDPLTVHENNLIGQYRFRIRGLGKVFDYLQTSTGFLLVVVLPVFIFFIYHLVQFFRVLFEYQNVKNRIKYEQERGRTEDLIAAQKEDAEKKEADRAALEAELREKLRAEILASMKEEKPDAAPKEPSDNKTE